MPKLQDFAAMALAAAAGVMIAGYFYNFFSDYELVDQSRQGFNI